MKKIISVIVVMACLLTSCTSQGRLAGDPTAIMLGAQIGGMAGELIGSSNSHTYRGALVGSLVGTITGAAIATAATAPRQSVEGEVEDEVYVVETRPYREHSVGRHERRSSGNYPEYRRYEEERSSDLEIRNIRFIDDNRNHVIESGERAKIIFEIVNNGSVAAYHVTPVVAEKNGIKHLNISASVTMECIPAGDGIRYTAIIKAGKLRKGEALFHLTALDGRGGMIPIREFVIPVQK